MPFSAFGIQFGKAKSVGSTGRDPFLLFQQFRDATGPYQNKFLQDIDSLLANRRANPYLDNVGNVLNRNANLPSLLRARAAGSTDAATRAAAIASRTAAGARGGLAYGGGAGELAGRASALAGASTGQALLGAETDLAGYNLQEGNILLQQGALFQQLQEGDLDRQLSARQRYIELLGGLGTAGISGAGGSPLTPSKSNQYNFGVQGGLTP